MKRKNEIVEMIRHVTSELQNGKSLSRSVVDVFSRNTETKDAARKIMLGIAPGRAISSIRAEKKEERMLLSLISNMAGSDTLSLAKKAERISNVFEYWMRIKNQRMEVMRLLAIRGYMLSAVLGAVVSMIASIGPMISSSNFISTSRVNTSLLVPSSFLLSVISSFFVGLYFNRKKFYINIITVSVCYILVYLATGQIRSISVP